MSGDGRRETGDGRRETGEMGDGRWEMSGCGGRQEMVGDGRPGGGGLTDMSCGQVMGLRHEVNHADLSCLAMGGGAMKVGGAEDWR